MVLICCPVQTAVFQSNTGTREEIISFARPYPVYENKMIVPVVIEPFRGNARKRGALVHTEIGSQETSGDGNVANFWIEVHLERGTRNCAGDCLPGRAASAPLDLLR